MLVLGGVHAAAQGVGHPPQLGLVTHGGGRAVIRLPVFGHRECPSCERDTGFLTLGTKMVTPVFRSAIVTGQTNTPCDVWSIHVTTPPREAHPP